MNPRARYARSLLRMRRRAGMLDGTGVPWISAVTGYQLFLHSYYMPEIRPYTQAEMRRDRENARAFHNSITDNGKRRPVALWLPGDGTAVPVHPDPFEALSRWTPS